VINYVTKEAVEKSENKSFEDKN